MPGEQKARAPGTPSPREEQGRSCLTCRPLQGDTEWVGILVTHSQSTLTAAGSTTQLTPAPSRGQPWTPHRSPAQGSTLTLLHGPQGLALALGSLNHAYSPPLSPAALSSTSGSLRPQQPGRTCHSVPYDPSLIPVLGTQVLMFRKHKGSADRGMRSGRGREPSIWQVNAPLYPEMAHQTACSPAVRFSPRLRWTPVKQDVMFVLEQRTRTK